jgi:hypothetical protein
MGHRVRLRAESEGMVTGHRRGTEASMRKPNELAVFMAGQPVGRPGSTNLMKLRRIGMG